MYFNGRSWFVRPSNVNHTLASLLYSSDPRPTNAPAFSKKWLTFLSKRMAFPLLKLFFLWKTALTISLF